jgi:glycosyltransferase involved in cell wall biosynthesis
VSPLRVGVDATPLLGPRTGVGRYVSGLVHGLTGLADAPDVTLTAFTARGARSVPHEGGARVAGRPFPARLLQQLWSRVPFPPVELLSGPLDVFHGTNYVLPPARRARGVLSVHDLSYVLHADTVTPQVLRYQRLVPAGVRRAAVVLTLTEASADEVAAFYGLARDRVLVASPGVDAEWAATKRPTSQWLHDRGLPERYLLFVGTQEPRKNLQVLVSALEVMQRELGDEAPPLVIAGPAGWGAAPDCSGLRPGSLVRTGFLDDDALRAVVAGATCLAFPSRHEGFGMPPLEALACGVSVVSSDLPVLREVTGDCARYAPVGDVDAWAAAITDALPEVDDDERARRRARAAAFTWEGCAASAMSAYRLALA